MTAFAVIIAGSADPKNKTVATFHDARGRDVHVLLEIAATPAARAQGLMNRDTLGDNAGMLFVFPDAEPRTFWMKNTRIALDIVFLAADGQIAGIVARAEPLTLTPRTIPEAAKFVVEVQGGFIKSHNIAVGSRVTFDGLPDIVE